MPKIDVVRSVCMLPFFFSVLDVYSEHCRVMNLLMDVNYDTTSTSLSPLCSDTYGQTLPSLTSNILIRMYV